jgi:hypothetical protein
VTNAPSALPTTAAAQFFSPTSFWNTASAASQQVDPNSPAMIANLMQVVSSETAAHTGPWLNARQDGVAIVTVPAGQPTVRVTLNHAPDAALSSAWSQVPLPPNAQPSPGDNDLAVSQPSTNRLWEFFELHDGASGWQAEWGGAIDDASSNAGVYGPDAWSGAEYWWGVTATSFSVVGGVVTFNDLAAGAIDHALAIVLPDARYGSYVAPAERDDGTSTSVGAIPEGSRLRLDPSLNLSSLNLPPMVRMLAQAAQRYGIYVRDYSPTVAFIGQDPTTSAYGSSLYGAAYDGMSTAQLMQYFPWSHLQVVKQTVEYGW